MADEDNWTSVVSKKTQKKEKLEKKHNEKADYELRMKKRQMERDARYLLTHSVFQEHKLTKDQIEKLMEKTGETRVEKLYVIGHGVCIGHLICYDKEKKSQDCLQCGWKAPREVDYHCCCPEEVVKELRSNFYLGCNGPVNTYLELMREAPISASCRESPQ